MTILVVVWPIATDTSAMAAPDAMASVAQLCVFDSLEVAGLSVGKFRA